MASKDSYELPCMYEFNCPQFVDFTKVDSSPKFANELGGIFSPEFQDAASSVNIRSKSSSTSKVYAAAKVNVSSYQTPICHASNATDSDKRHRTGLSKRLSRSDSSVNLCSQNIKAANTNTSHLSIPKQHNRSLSESDVRTKARMGPTTPMCLKRTLCRTKVKKLKTSEELELEKIAELQKQMHQHLRANEVAMRRLKLKTRPCTVKNEIDKAEAKSRKNLPTNLPKDNKYLGKPNDCEQNTSPHGTREGTKANAGFVAKAKREKIFMSHLNELRATRCKQVPGPSSQEGNNNLGGVATEADRDKVFMTRLNHLRETTCKQLYGNQSNQQNSNLPSTSNTDVDGLKSIENKPKAYTAHPGLNIVINHQKVTTCKPFNFDRKEKFASSSTPGISNQIKDKLKMRIPGTCYKLSGKENNKFQKSLTDVKKAKDLKKGTPFHASNGSRI